MTMHFAHSMPHGAEPGADGTVRFRLWAPGQPAMSVVLSGRDRMLPMAPAGDGWFELVTAEAGPGTLYQFQPAEGPRVPDPASRGQAEDAHGPSVVVDPRAYRWRHGDWHGRPWHEAVLYELHTGLFSPEGTFDDLRRRLDHFERMGITGIELMPIADFPGRRNWGYDGVLLFAPDTSYGRPEDLKALIDEAHGRGLMVFLDVVYNHFGPDGNYLHVYAPGFFTERHHTPWGAAIDFTRRPVRDFYIHNTLYWLQEYRLDGLRFDAVHSILDDSETHILAEIADTVRRTLPADRHVHLVLENEANQARYLNRAADGRPMRYTAQWNDDFHNTAHVILTGETAGYYEHYKDRPLDRLSRSLAEGFVYQGEKTPLGKPRGEPSGHLPPAAFVNFLQNHDQVGNRAYGERLIRLTEPAALRTATAVMLLAPEVPLLFMGEEWGSDKPFLFFCDFHDELAELVRNGRRREFAHFPQFADPKARETIPDPNADETFEAGRLDWSMADAAGTAAWRDLYRELLRLRREVIVPRLPGMTGNADRRARWGAGGLSVGWTLGDGARLTLCANLGPDPSAGCPPPAGEVLYETGPGVAAGAAEGAMPPWSAVWFFQPA